MNKKLLVLDIDGTLTNQKKQITAKTRETIIKMMDMGHSCMLATGRPTPGVLFIADELEFALRGGYSLSYNGARVINHKTGEVVFEQKLDNKYIPELFEFAKTYDCGILTYNEKEVISGTFVDEYVKFEANLLRLPIKEVEDFDKITFPVNKCLMTAAPEKAEKLCEVLAEKYKGVMGVFRSEPFFIEIVPLGVDKAKSIEKVLPILGFDKSDLICCGDGYNDVSMIKFASEKGVGVAMANAVAEVKSVANFYTLSNEQDGVAWAVEKLVFEKE
ncbi:MAG: Cof-type HAD-IIB family hydrolase [Bacillota bacterium]